MARSVQARFFLSCIATASLVLAVFVVVMDVVNRNAVEVQLTEKLNRVAANHSILLADPVGRHDMVQTELVLSSAISDPDIIHIAVTDDDGVTLASLGRDQPGSGSLIAQRTIRMGNAEEIRTIGLLTIEMTNSHLVAAARQRLSISAMVGVLLLATLLAVSDYIHRRFIGRPIREMKSVIDGTERGLGEARVMWQSQDDIGAVVEAFNSMRDRQSAFEHALQEAHATLEQRVQERTAALVAARDEAEAANRAKGAFLASMSHELRTPLNAMIGFAQLIEMKERAGDFEKSDEYIRDILNSGEHLLNLINDLLDLSKIEAGRSELFETDVEVGDLIETVVDMVASLAQCNGISIATETPEDDIVLHADTQKVCQIVLNLLSNAIKFTPSGGQVTVSVERDRWGKLALVVSDTGIGIAREDVARVLEPFEQVRLTHHQATEGTGLGLPLANGLAAMHGGKLRISSKPGRGTRVTVTFPAKRVSTPKR